MHSHLLHQLTRFLGGLVAAYFFLLVILYFYQRRLQYFPDSSEVPALAGHEFQDIQNIELKAPDGVRLLGWYWPGTLPVTLVMFHGNGGHRGHRIDWLTGFHRLGYGLFILDYRGYGGSDGSPTEQGLYADAETAIRWLQKNSQDRLTYFGESLGCAVAIEMACRFPPATLILQAGFASADEIARQAYPYLPVGWLLKDRYDSRGKMRQLHCPVLMIHGNQDSIISMQFGRRLFDLAQEPKEWLLISGGDHNDLPWVGGQVYWNSIDAFQRRRLGLDETGRDEKR
ncbi:MAG: alpha/beta hydrolase [Terriglobia bacterium]